MYHASNPTFAADLLSHAIDLYQWGTEKETTKYSNYYRSATASIYPSSDAQDDLAWAAYWLYRATGNRTYLQSSVNYYRKKSWDVTIDWDNSGAAVAVALANLAADGVSVPYASDITNFVVKNFLQQWMTPSGEIRRTPNGMHYPKWSRWGNAQLSTTAAFAAAVHAKHTQSNTLRQSAVQFARDQLDYVMGGTDSGFSFIVGFGSKYPLRPHHAGASCPSDRSIKCDWSDFDRPDPNPMILYGALVGGPEGPGDNSYNDKRSDYVSNEVASDYNSGLTGALAGVVQFL